MRDTDIKKIDNIRCLKQQILDQFGNEFVDEDLTFNIGYHEGTTHIWIHTESDLSQLLRIMQSKSPTLWCDGVEQQKRKLPASEGSSGSDNDQHSQTTNEDKES